MFGRFVDGPEFVQGLLYFDGSLGSSVFPGLDLLVVMLLRVDLDAVRAQGLEAVDVDAEIGELFSGVFEALQA